jgi:sugar phosphate isomerase/epimerase
MTGDAQVPARDGVAAAGYKLTGLLSGHRGEAFTSSKATPEYLDGLKKRIAQRGLTVNMTAIHFRPEAELTDNIGDVRKQIENAARLELKFMLTFGVEKPEHYEDFYRLMADAAPQAEGTRTVGQPPRPLRDRLARQGPAA